MLLKHQHLEAAENVRTLRDIHRWLIQVAGDEAVSDEVRDICNDFAIGLEPALEVAVMKDDIYRRIWNVFQLLTLASSSKAPAMENPDWTLNFPDGEFRSLRFGCD